MIGEEGAEVEPYRLTDVFAVSRPSVSHFRCEVPLGKLDLAVSSEVVRIAGEMGFEGAHEIPTFPPAFRFANPDRWVWWKRFVA